MTSTPEPAAPDLERIHREAAHPLRLIHGAAQALTLMGKGQEMADALAVIAESLDRAANRIQESIGVPPCQGG
jgi:hypothetical protein